MLPDQKYMYIIKINVNQHVLSIDQNSFCLKHKTAESADTGFKAMAEHLRVSDVNKKVFWEHMRIL